MADTFYLWVNGCGDQAHLIRVNGDKAHSSHHDLEHEVSALEIFDDADISVCCQAWMLFTRATQPAYTMPIGPKLTYGYGNHDYTVTHYDVVRTGGVTWTFTPHPK